jgi:hypothetical protein
MCWCPGTRVVLPKHWCASTAAQGQTQVTLPSTQALLPKYKSGVAQVLLPKYKVLLLSTALMNAVPSPSCKIADAYRMRPSRAPFSSGAQCENANQGHLQYCALVLVSRAKYCPQVLSLKYCGANAPSTVAETVLKYCF